MSSLRSKLKDIVPLRIFAVYFLRIKRGLRLYKSVLGEFGSESTIYVQHYPGTGDIYLAASLLDHYTRREGTRENAVMTVIGGAGKKIARMFGIQRVKVLSQGQTDLLVRLAMFTGSIMPQLQVTHYHPIKMTTGILDRLCSFKGTDFISMYLEASFPGMAQSDIALPTQEPDLAAVDRIFKENGLIPGRTVVLSPYANTTTLLGDQFWDKIAKALIRSGYTVCTNSAGPAEPAVANTVPVCPEFKDVNAFLERAGFLVALRSGFCELAMHARCKQIILYPKPNYYRFGVGTLYDYFSFSNMGVRDDLTEIVCRTENLKKAKRKVLQAFSAMADASATAAQAEQAEVS